MSEWVPMTVETKRSTSSEGLIKDILLHRIQNPNDEVGFISFYIVGVDESGYKLSDDIMGPYSPGNGYHFTRHAFVGPKSESITWTEFSYSDGYDPPYAWEVALEESNSWWENGIGELDDLYSEGNIGFIPMKPSDYNIFMIQVDDGVISGGVPWILHNNLSTEIFYKELTGYDVELIDVDPSNNDYFSIDEAFLYNNTDSTIVAQFACDVTESYPDYLPKFPDVENIPYSYARQFEVGSKTRADEYSKES